MVAPGGRVAHSPTALALTTMFGVQSMHAYVQFGWLPQIYRDAGFVGHVCRGALASVSGIGLFGGLLIAGGDRARRGLGGAGLASFGVILMAGYAGLILAPATVPWLWAALLAVSGFAFPRNHADHRSHTRAGSDSTGVGLRAADRLPAGGSRALPRRRAAVTEGWTSC